MRGRARRDFADSHRVSTGSVLVSSDHAAIKLVFTGDVLLSDAAQPFLDTFGYSYPFKHLAKLLKGDIVVGNLEGPLTDRGAPIALNKKYIYRCPPEAGQALKRAGFTLFSLANNHILDYGRDGLEQTICVLEQLGLGHVGAGMTQTEARRPIILSVRGIEVGFLAYMERWPAYERFGFYASQDTAGVSLLSTSALTADITSLRPLVDALVVMFHWGDTYQPVGLSQRCFGRLAIRAGADIVIGHHAHVHQVIETYRGRPIIYSLGNFAFGTRGRRSLRWGLVVGAEAGPTGLKRLEVIPIKTQNREVLFQPRTPPTAEARHMLSEYREACAAANTRVHVRGRRGYVVYKGRPR